jgi:hypothetical protein
MPGYSWTEPDLQRRGPVLDVGVTISAADEAALQAAGRPVPAPVTVQALVDTGAGISGLGAATARLLGLVPTDTRLIATPSAAAVWMNVYTIRFLLPGGAEEEVKAAGAELAGHGTGAILGRDVLAHAMFVYVGYAGQCTISF